jgi:hypothetical protein
MATGRIESGRVDIRAPGSAPVQRVGIGEVNYVAPRVQAQGAGQLAETLDRMSANLFQDAMVSRQREGLQFTAENPLTPQQIEAAKRGDLTTLDLGGNPFSVYQQAVRKARSLELAGKFEEEGRAELVNILSQVEQGQATAQQVQAKVNTMIDGMGKSLAKVDAEASYKFRATMATYGNGVLKSALDEEMRRTRNERRIKFDMDLQHTIRLLENFAVTDPETYNERYQIFRANINQQALLLNDPAVQRDAMTAVEKAFTDGRVNALLKGLMNDSNLRDPNTTIRQLREGTIYSPTMDGSRLRAHIDYLRENDFASLMRVEETFMKSAAARRQAIELGYNDAENKGNELLRQMYNAKTPGQVNELYRQFQQFPVSAGLAKQARDFVTSDMFPSPDVDDLTVFAALSQKVAAGLANSREIINAPLKSETKKQLLSQLSNPNDDISYGTRLINMAVGIQSENLPPELKDADARQLATATRNELVTSLYLFARTPNARGVLPTPAEIRAYGEQQSRAAGGRMGRAFTQAAESNQAQAVQALPELRGVDLMDAAAVEAAFTAAAKRRADAVVINAARASVDAYRQNKSKVAAPAGGR